MTAEAHGEQQDADGDEGEPAHARIRTTAGRGCVIGASLLGERWRWHPVQRQGGRAGEGEP
ncbi:hypothetical protein ACVB8X_40160 [Streptomyces sp. NRAIS4]